MSIQRILVPTDFSARADEALDYAISLGRRLPGARIDLLHSYGVPRRSLLPYDVAIPEPTLSSIRDAAARKLVVALDRVKAAGLDAEIHLAEAEPAQAIADAAERLSSDLVAIATHGHTGFKHVLLGSVAERTLRIAGCPVLAVRERASHGDQPLQLRRILVPTDLSAASDRALELAVELALTAGPTEVHVLHSDFIPPTLRTLLGADLEPESEALSQRLSEELDRVVAELRSKGVDASSTLTRGRPEEVIVEVARETGADLITMGTHGRTGLGHAALGSVAERVLRSAPCPTLAVKP